MTIKNVLGFGKSKGACVEALLWLSAQTDAEQAWLTCERPDWMIWYAAKRGIDRKIIVRIACDCARTALRFVPKGEDRPRIAIETTERWIDGTATIDEVRTAQRHAYAAADDAYAAAYAADDAYAAAYAATAAAVVAAAADDAAYVVDAAVDAAVATDATDAVAYAARKQSNIKMREIVRRHIPYKDIAL